MPVGFTSVVAKVSGRAALVALCLTAASCSELEGGRVPVESPRAKSAPVRPIAEPTPLSAASDAAVVDEPGDARGAREVSPGELVDVLSLDESIAVDMRYATANNFLGAAIYAKSVCLLRRSVAERLVRAHQILSAKGLALQVWDCYRPFSVQERLWAKVSDPRYVARPVRTSGLPSKGSRHNRGAAVDLTLVRRDGGPVEMPTDHDDFSTEAHRESLGGSEAARRNASILDDAMTEAGFVGLPTEWWHYDDPGWRGFELLDREL